MINFSYNDGACKLVGNIQDIYYNFLPDTKSKASFVEFLVIRTKYD